MSRAVRFRATCAKGRMRKGGIGRAVRRAKGAFGSALLQRKGKTVSGSQRALKIISILLIVWAIVLIAFGAFLAFGAQSGAMAGDAVSADGTVADASAIGMALGVGTVFGGVVNLVIALLGLRGAKNPRKIGAFYVLCIIGAVLGLIGLGMSIAQGAVQWSSVVSLVIVVACFFLANSIRKQA